jgi:hypothetical protein
MLRRARVTGFLACGLLVAAFGCQSDDYRGPQTITPRMDLAPEATERYRELLIGKWYLEQPRSDGTTVRSLSKMTSDGTLRIEFQVIHPNGMISESSEKLIWGISGDIFQRRRVPDDFELPRTRRAN